jgi:glycosyltransferase involved in cell wall biosynthesis
MNDLPVAESSSAIPGTQEEQKEPLLSVVIPTWNRAQHLRRCLIHLFREIEANYRNAEVIVIDGGSTDETVQILKEYDTKIAYWVSERDSGVSEAVNKGLRQAKGEILRLFGDDDEVVPGSFRGMIDYMVKHPEVDVLAGHAAFFSMDESGTVEPLVNVQPTGRLALRSFLSYWFAPCPTPEAAFQRRKLFEQFGGYDLRYHYAAWLELWLRFASKGAVFEAVPQVVVRRFMTPETDSIKGNWARISGEYDRVIRQYGGFFWVLRNHCRGDMRPLKVISVLAFDLCQRFNVHPLRAARAVKKRLLSRAGT